MKSGYDQFFKNARKAVDDGNSGVPVKKSAGPRLNLDLASEDIDEKLRRRMNMPLQKRFKAKKNRMPFKVIGTSMVGLLLALWGFQNHNQVEQLIKRVEFTMTGEASAEEAKPVEKAKDSKSEKDSKDSKDSKAPGSNSGGEDKMTSSTGEDLTYLLKLNDRKKELDAREEELNRQESELQAQKVELDKRLKELEDMRGRISSILEDRVKADDQKVETLVQLYTNMKAPQAAKIFETMDEDLVVELLGRMKKKNAADIMNLLKPDKAQNISEKFAGYKRR